MLQIDCNRSYFCTGCTYSSHNSLYMNISFQEKFEKRMSNQNFVPNISLFHESFFLFFQGYVSVDLSPVAAVSAQLFSGDTELHMSGPIHFTLTVPDSWGLHTSNVIPAWYFNRSTGEYKSKTYSIGICVYPNSIQLIIFLYRTISQQMSSRGTSKIEPNLS